MREELWDLKLEGEVWDLDNWREEKTGVGPNKPPVSSDVNITARATMYADDNSARESAKTVVELK